MPSLPQPVDAFSSGSPMFADIELETGEWFDDPIAGEPT